MRNVQDPTLVVNLAQLVRRIESLLRQLIENRKAITRLRPSIKMPATVQDHHDRRESGRCVDYITVVNQKS